MSDSIDASGREGPHRLALSALAMVTALFLAAPQTALAQETTKVEVTGYGGVALTGGDMKLLPLESTGTAFGASVGYKVNERVSFRLDGNFQSWSADEEEDPNAPGASLTHFTIGPELRLSPPDFTRWVISVSGGAGIGSVDFDPFTSRGSTVDLSESYPLFTGGLKVGYQIAEQVDLNLRTSAYLVSADRQQTRPLETLSLKVKDGPKAFTTFPITLGLTVEF